MSEIAIKRLALPSVDTVTEARSRIRGMAAGENLPGFVMGLSGVELSPDAPAKVIRHIGSMFNRTLSRLNLYRADYVDFGPQTPDSKGFGLHIDGVPGVKLPMKSLNFHITFSGELDVDLTATTSKFWENGWCDVPHDEQVAFAEGRIDPTLFGPVYSTHVEAPALVVHQLDGKYPTAHCYSNAGTENRHSASLVYDYGAKPVDISELVFSMHD